MFNSICPWQSQICTELMPVLQTSGISKKNRINEHSGTIDQTEVALLMNSKARENVHKIFEIYH